MVEIKSQENIPDTVDLKKARECKAGTGFKSQIRWTWFIVRIPDERLPKKDNYRTESALKMVKRNLNNDTVKA